MKVLSLFSGIGAFEKALTNIGADYEVVGFSEIDKYAIESYSVIHDVDKSLNLGDISSIKTEDMPDCDMVTYGFPCQDISVAGNLKGIIEGETRSGLLFEALRVIRDKKPNYAIAENVKNLVGKKFKKDFEGLLQELEEMGYNNYWKVLNAKDYGIPQNRERVFVISIRKDIDTGNFEFPKGFESGLRLKDFLLDEVDNKYYIENERTENLISQLKDKLEKPCIVASRGRNPNNPSDRTVGSPTEQRLEPNSQGIANTLTTVQKDNLVLESKRLGGLYDTETKRRQAGAVWDKEQLSPTIDTCQGGHREPLIIEDIPQVAVREATKQGYAIASVGDSINISFPNSQTRRGRVGEGVAQTLETGCNQATLENDYRIRKLTPNECWRLMGFSDEDYEKARQALMIEFYNGKDRSNSQMYKMAGNSIVVNVLEGILKNLIR